MYEDIEVHNTQCWRMCTGDTGENMSHSGVSTKMHSGLQNATHEGIFGYFCDDVEFHIQHC